MLVDSFETRKGLCADQPQSHFISMGAKIESVLFYFMKNRFSSLKNCQEIFHSNNFNYGRIFPILFLCIYLSSFFIFSSSNKGVQLLFSLTNWS